MTVDEIVTQAEREYGARFSVKKAQIVKFADYLQKIAFNKDLDAFLQWSVYMTIVPASLGPYAFPTVPPCRKLVGVTRLTDDQLLGDALRFTLSDCGLDLNDYDERRMFEKGRIDAIARTFKFLTTPDSAANTYRWIYYRRAPTITGFDSANDANLLIGEEFHQTLMVDGIGALCDKATWGGKTPEEVLLPFLEPYWESLVEQSTGKGKDSGGLSQGQP